MRFGNIGAVDKQRQTRGTPNARGSPDAGDDSSPPSPTVPATDRVVDHIRSRIRNGVLAPGQRLIEADITAELEVSRGPVREAFRRLAAEGLLVEERHRGTRVRQVTLDELKAIYRVREMLEGLAARMAAERVAAGASTRTLERIAAQLDRALGRGDMPAYFELNSAFHHEVVELGRMPLLATLLEQLNIHVFRLQFWHLLQVRHAKHSNREHREIAQAIVDGDGERAERLMRTHVRASGESIFNAPPSMLPR